MSSVGCLEMEKEGTWIWSERGKRIYHLKLKNIPFNLYNAGQCRFNWVLQTSDSNDMCQDVTFTKLPPMWRRHHSVNNKTSYSFHINTFIFFKQQLKQTNKKSPVCSERRQLAILAAYMYAHVHVCVCLERLYKNIQLSLTKLTGGV